MNEFAEFLAACLDDEEAAAKRASRDKANGDEWRAGDGGDGWTQAGTPVLRPDGNAVAITIGDYAAEHVALHDPAQALREVAFKRKILAWHLAECTCTWVDAEGDGLPQPDVTGYGCPTLLMLGALYSTRPGYREEWAP